MPENQKWWGNGASGEDGEEGEEGEMKATTYSRQKLHDLEKEQKAKKTLGFCVHTTLALVNYTRSEWLHLIAHLHTLWCKNCLREYLTRVCVLKQVSLW